MEPIIAIVGRPNVGKSTLFNRLVKRKHAIVDNKPGVTRDRSYASAMIQDRSVTMVDTGGFESDSNEEIMVLMRRQTQMAIEEADLVIFMVDGMAGIIPEDKEIAKILRRADKDVVIAVNKVDGPKIEPNVLEFYELGLSDPIGISAKHGIGISDLTTAIRSRLGEEEKPTEIGDYKARVAIIGRPNVGKSSLINAILGYERLVVSDVPGTTRDSIDTTVLMGEDKYLFVDTAGVRRKARISQRLEQYSVIEALRAISHCDIAVLMIDGTEGITEQDAKLAGIAHDRNRGLILAVNKWDLKSKEKNAKRKILDERELDLKFLSYASMEFISAKTRTNINKLLDQIKKTGEEYNRRIETGPLNRTLEIAQKEHSHPSHQGREVKFYYITQASTAPPTFVVFTNYPKAVHFTYRRYLINCLRKAHGFSGIPIKLVIRHRSENDDGTTLGKTKRAPKPRRKKMPSR